MLRHDEEKETTEYLTISSVVFMVLWRVLHRKDYMNFGGIPTVFDKIFSKTNECLFSFNQSACITLPEVVMNNVGAMYPSEHIISLFLI